MKPYIDMNVDTVHVIIYKHTYIGSYIQGTGATTKESKCMNLKAF